MNQMRRRTWIAALAATGLTAFACSESGSPTDTGGSGGRGVTASGGAGTGSGGVGAASGGKSGAGRDASVGAADGGTVDAGAGGTGNDPDCFTNPKTHFEIINACTTAEHYDKTVTLPLLLPDGGLPELR